MACIRLLRACSTFNLARTLSLPDPLPALSQYLQTCSLEQLSPTIESLTKTRPKLSLAPLETSLQARLELMHFGQVIVVREALKKTMTRQFGEKLEDRAIALLPSMSIEEVTEMLRSFSGKSPRFGRLLSHIQAILKEKGSPLSVETKINALLSFYLSKYQPDQLLPLWASSISSNLEQLSWASLCQLLFAYSQVAGAHKKLFNSIDTRVTRSSYSAIQSREARSARFT